MRNKYTSVPHGKLYLGVALWSDPTKLTLLMTEYGAGHLQALAVKGAISGLAENTEKFSPATSGQMDWRKLNKAPQHINRPQLIHCFFNILHCIQ